jgi:2-dehydro-3-deoxygalactonokinase
MAAITQPPVIGLDWSTSSLRGYLLAADGGVIDSIAKPWGIQHLPASGFAGAFAKLAGEWRSRAPAVPVVAVGMAGSRQGFNRFTWSIRRPPNRFFQR